MDKTKRLKRIVYVPGMISLITVPFIFTYFTNKTLHRLSEGAIPIFWMSSEWINKYTGQFSVYRGHFPPQRAYQEVILTGDDLSDRIKLMDAQILVRTYLSTQDTLHGVHFHFGNNATYGNFVKAVDILMQEGAKTYIPYENDLWFCIVTPPKISESDEVQTFICGTSDMLITEPRQERSIWTTVATIWNNLWMEIIGFTLLLFVSVKRIVSITR